MVLVTGATGHIGNTLVRDLLAQGEKVRVLRLPAESAESLEGLDLEVIEGDILEPSHLGRALQGIEYVYHLAGMIRILSGAEQMLKRINVEGTYNVARAAREAGVRRLVYTSSIHALGRPPMDTVIDESCAFDPECSAGAYDRTKAEASLALLREVEKGLDAVIVCPTGVIGPMDFRDSEMGHLIHSWMAKRLHVLVDGSFDFVDARDVAHGLILACRLGRRGQAYILGGERVSVEALFQLVRQATGVKAPAVRIPSALARVAAPLCALFASLSGTPPQFTRYSLETLWSNSRVSIDKARRELGYAPRPLALSVRDTVEWWRRRDGELLAGRRETANAPVTVLRPWGRAAAGAARTATTQQPGARPVALVTGASSGIGAATARRLAAAGYTVALAARRQDRLEEVIEDIRSRGGTAQAFPVDLSSADGPRLLFEAVTRTFGGADVVVNNAGFGWYGWYEMMLPETAREMILVNNAALVELVVRFLPVMKRRGRGHIINVSSVAGSIPSQGAALYSATKSFVDSLSKALARELRGSGVRMSAVKPGPVLTEFYRRAASLSGGMNVPAERFGTTPDAVARVIARLVERPRRTVYIPRGLRVVPWVELGFGWLINLLGPLLLRRSSVGA